MNTQYQDWRQLQQHQQHRPLTPQHSVSAVWLYNTPLTFVMLDCLGGDQAGEDEEEAGSDGGHGGITVLLVWCVVVSLLLLLSHAGVVWTRGQLALDWLCAGPVTTQPVRCALCSYQPPSSPLCGIPVSSTIYLFIDYLHIYPSENRTVVVGQFRVQHQHEDLHQCLNYYFVHCDLKFSKYQSCNCNEFTIHSIFLMKAWSKPAGLYKRIRCVRQGLVR